MAKLLFGQVVQLFRGCGKDTVEVETKPLVLCKDCKHCFLYDEGNVQFNVCDLLHNKVQPDDWFCADGEMKDDGTRENY